MMWGSHIISGKKLIPYLGWYNAGYFIRLKMREGEKIASKIPKLGFNDTC